MPSPSLRSLLCGGLPAAWILIAATGCRQARIETYDAPKESRPEAPAQPGLPDGHPPIPPSASTASSPSGESPAPGRPPAPGSMAATAVPTAHSPAPAWDPPAHWQRGPASSMRIASFTIAGEDGARAEVAVTAFPGQVGNTLSNLNRWRDQIGLDRLGESEGAAAATPLRISGEDGQLVDFSGPNNRLIVAWLQHGGTTWFFKCTGPVSLLEREKPGFLSFVQSVRFPQP